jgi:hypothetical protein
MKKLFLLFIATFIFVFQSYSSDFSVNINFGYNFGTSDLFNKYTTNYSENGTNFSDEIHNKMGLGFNLSCNIPVVKRFYVIPGFSINYGNQSFIHTGITEDETPDVERNNYYFRIYSGELNFLYDLFQSKNGWDFNLLLGFNYNSIKTGDNMNEKDDKYWGLLTGIGARFFQHRHFGFQVLLYNQLPFKNNYWAYIGIRTGISYKF